MRVPRLLTGVVRGVAQGFIRLGVRPDSITLSSLLASLASAVAFGTGHLTTGGLLFLFSGLLDILDGHVARAGGTASARGAFLDSVADRYAELAVFTGIAIYFSGGWPLVVTLLALGGSLMVSYARARGEGLGVKVAEVGFLQRPERILAVGVPSLFASHLVLVWALGFVAAAAHLSALWRLRHVYRSLPAPADQTPPPRRLATRPRTAPTAPSRG